MRPPARAVRHAGAGLVLPPREPSPALPAGDPTGVPTSGAPYGSTAWLTTVAREAEAAGAAAVWATDHLFWGGPTLECLTALAAAATATTTTLLGSCVLQLPLRSPAAVAKQAAALQQLSGNRMVLGIGVGSHAGEYARAGASFADRGRRLDEGIAAIRAAWRAAPVPDHRPGSHPDGGPATATVAAARYAMAPAVPAPIWVGGSSPAALRRAALAGDGWIPVFVNPDRYAAGLGEVRRVAETAGRDPDGIAAAVVVPVSVGDDQEAAHAQGTRWLADLYGLAPRAFDRHLVAGPPARCAESIARFVAAGAEHVAVLVAGDDAVGQFRALAPGLVRLLVEPDVPATPTVPSRDLMEVGA